MKELILKTGFSGLNTVKLKLVKEKASMKEKLIKFIKEPILYFIIIVIMLSITSKLGWTDAFIWDDAIVITLGWTVWKIIMIIIESRKNKKSQ